MLGLLIPLLVIGAVAGGLYAYFTRPAYLIALAQQALADATGAEVRIAHASFSLTGPIVLQEVEFFVPEMSAGGDVLRVQRVLIEHNRWGIFRHGIVLHRMELQGARLYVTEILETGEYNFHKMLARRAHDPDDDLPVDITLPVINLPDAQLIVGEVQGGQYTQVASMQLYGVMAHRDRAVNPNVYDFSLRPRGQSPGPSLTGSFDLDRAMVDARLDVGGLDSPLLSLLPHGLRQWWLEREAQGSLHPIELHFDASQGARIVLRVDDTQLTPPYASRPLRMQVKQGSFAFTMHEAAGRIDIKLDGRVADFDYKVAGHIHNPFDTGPEVDLRILVEGAIVPEPEFLQHLDAELRDILVRLLERYRPEGRFDADIHLTHGREHEGLHHDILLTVHGGKSIYEEFKVPLVDIHGQIRLRPRFVAFMGLTARTLSGSKVTWEGTVQEFGPLARSDLRFHSPDLIIDQPLLDALPPQSRRFVEQSMSRPDYQRLLDAGLVRASVAAGAQAIDEAAAPASTQAIAADEPSAAAGEAEAAGAADAVPVFDLGGPVDVKVRVVRNPDHQPVWTTTVDADLQGAGLLFANWPYPVVVESGAIHVHAGAIDIRDLKVKGLTGTRGMVRGTFQRPANKPDAQSVPDIRITTTHTPIDPILKSTLPETYIRQLEMLHLEGLLRGDAKIDADEHGRTRYHVTVDFEDVTSTPAKDRGGRYTLTDLKGQVIIEPGHVRIGEVTGRHGDSRLTVKGAMLADPVDDADRLTLSVQGSGMRFEDAVLDLTLLADVEAKDLRELVKQHQPRGRYDLSLSYRIDVRGETSFVTSIDPSELQLRLGDGTFHAREMTGLVRVAGDTLRFEDLAGKFEESGRFRVAGWASTHEGFKADLELDLACDSLSKQTRVILPQGVVAVLDRLQWQGGYEVEGAKLRYRPDSAQDTTIAFAGAVTLKGGAMNVGVPITDLDASVGVGVTYGPKMSVPRLDIRVQADRMRVQERKVEDVQLRLSNTDDQRHRLLLEGLNGKVYGGTLTGEGQLAITDRDVNYRLELSIQRAAMFPLINPDREAEWAAAVKADEKEPWVIRSRRQPVTIEGKPLGELSASLAIQGKVSDLGSRQGRGEIEIRNARLYEFPFGMAALHIANFNIPVSSFFENASVQYILNGRTVMLDEVRLESPSLELVGKDGTLDWITQDIDLRLLSRNPARLKLGPLPDIWDMIKAELLTIRITGKVGDPKISTEQFKGTREAWQQIFGSNRRS